MRDYIASPAPSPRLGQRGRGELLGSAGRALLIAAAVILGVYESAEKAAARIT